MRHGIEPLHITATYVGQDEHGNHLLRDLSGDVGRDHQYVNGVHGNWPEGIRTGQRVRFWATPLNRWNGKKITDIRNLEVIE